MNLLAAAVTCLLCAQSYGGPLNLHGMRDLSLDGSASGTGTQENPVAVNGILSDIDGILQIVGIKQFGNQTGTSHRDALWLHLDLLNDTGKIWENIDFELQTNLGKASTNPDGLSFGQGYLLEDRPWTSSEFSDFNELTQDRDFINFFDGEVLPGERANFNFIVSQNGNGNAIFLRVRPNFMSEIPPAAPPPVPEPQSFAIAILAGLMWIGYRRGTRKQDATVGSSQV